MTDPVLVQTGPYAHKAELKEEIRFTSVGDVERSFTILIADHAIGSPEDETRRGIAILDNDNASVVLDGICEKRDPYGLATRIRFADIGTMDWKAFSAYCRSAETFRGDQPDIVEPCDLPRNGDVLRQAALGLNIDPSKDNRSTAVKALSENPDVPYRFPLADRDRMTAEICRHLMFIENGGQKSHIAWDIRMQKGWNKTGRIKGGTAVNAEFDSDWRHTIETNPHLSKRACAQAIAPFITAPMDVFDNGKFPCEFQLIGRNKGFLILHKFCGNFMLATRDVSMCDRLMRLRDDEIEALWVTCRVLDYDLSQPMRAAALEAQMHDMRLAYERGTLEIDA